jgi:hypothetical protein
MWGSCVVYIVKHVKRKLMEANDLIWHVTISLSSNWNQIDISFFVLNWVNKILFVVCIS